MSDSIMDALGDQGATQNQTEIVHGVVPAIVSNVKDPDKLGRIKVNFPWLAENSESDWIRVASFMAGKERGAFFLPEVEDEVLVAFQQGNVNSPYVIGSLWSNKSQPPEKNEDGKNNIKLIKTRVGHIITLDDNASAPKIDIKSKSGHQIILDDASGSEKITIKDKTGSNKIIFDSTGNSIAIESALELKIKSVNITIEASASLTLKGAMIKAEASGIAEIKGSMVKIN